MSHSQPQYEAVVFGATGYTGKFTAEHIATNLPADFKWAIAGRSESKLKTLAGELRELNPDRTQPGIEVAQLSKEDLTNLAKKTKVLISTVGPYHRWGQVAFEACAQAGTHYLDCTGEVPWVCAMTDKYNHVAQKSGAIMIPQCGVESAPADLMAWMLVQHIRRTLNTGATELINVLHDIKATASGGTLETALSLTDSYTLREIARAMSPFSLCTIAPPEQIRRKPILEAVTGLRHDPDLGLLTDSIQGPTDAPIVNRTWSLIDGGKFYGPKFQLNSYMSTTGKIKGFLVHIALIFGFAALLLPPFRWLARKFVYAPGQGASREQARKEYAEWRAIANADVTDDNDPKRAFGRIRWDGSMYHLTGACLAEAAITISRDETLAHQLGGGVYTPAMLGASFLERLQKAGLQTDVYILP